MRAIILFGLFLIAGAVNCGSAACSPPSEPADGPFVVLARRPDQIFILPLNTVRRSDPYVSLVLVTANVDPASEKPESPDELAQIVEDDAEVEIDCGAKSIRFIGGLNIDGAGRAERVDAPIEARKWQPLNENFPPFYVLERIVCEKTDTSHAVRLNLRKALPALQIAR